LLLPVNFAGVFTYQLEAEDSDGDNITYVLSSPEQGTVANVSIDEDGLYVLFYLPILEYAWLLIMYLNMYIIFVINFMKQTSEVYAQFIMWVC